MTLGVLSLIDAFKWRHATRKFDPQFSSANLTAAQTIIDEVSKIKSPFGTDSTIGNHPPGIGIGPTIKQEAGWVIGKTRKRFNSKQVFDAAYKAQIAVMKLAQHKIGTVWVAGNYRAIKASKSCPGYSVPFGIAYGGVPDGEKVGDGWSNSLMSRKNLEEIFFDLKENRTITEKTAGENIDFYQAIRYGPSAINQQPWRFVVEPNAIHLYDSRKILKWLGDMDMGIAAANIVLLQMEKGLNPEFAFLDNPPMSPLGGKYVCTISTKGIQQSAFQRVESRPKENNEL